MKNKCLLCGIESEDVVLMEFKDGWVYACQSIKDCVDRCSKQLVAKNLSQFHKGERCKVKPDVLCQENGCSMCQLDKEKV